jgi:hypothetical protein
MESKVATLESHLPQEPTFGIREPRWIAGWATPAISKYQNIRKQLRREACDLTVQLLGEFRLGDVTLVEGQTIGVFLVVVHTLKRLVKEEFAAVMRA